MKYVMAKSEEGSHHWVIFPDEMVHYTMARILEVAVLNCHKPVIHTISAGFVTLEGGRFKVSGRSESMGFESRPIDEAYLTLGESVRYLEPHQLDPLWKLWMERNDAKMGRAEYHSSSHYQGDEHGQSRVRWGCA